VERGAAEETCAAGKGNDSLTTAKPTAELLAAPARGAQWWVVAGTLFAFGLAAVLGYAFVRFGEGRFAEGPAPLVAEGADLALVQGTARKDGSSLLIEGPGADGAAVLAAKLNAFQAREFSRIEWGVASAQAPDIAFIWRTRENPRRTFSKRLRWLVTGAAPLELSAEDGWSGTITGVGLVVASMNTPVRVNGLRVVSPSVVAEAGNLARQWSSRNALRGYSVNYPLDAERGHDVPALVGVAVAEALAFALYLLLARWRGWSRDRRVLWGIFLAGWLLLDLRWQSNLWREAGSRAARFAGKSTAEMHLAADDAPLYAMIDKMKSALPVQPVRVFLYCDNDNLCARAAFLLYPQNVYRAVHGRRTLPAPEELHEGDYLLLVYSRALGYDRAKQAAVWRDGRSKPADEVLLEPGGLLLKVR
jgi:hypothetical protein